MSAEAHLHKMVQTVLKRLKFHLVDYLIDKGKLKEELRLLKTDAALLHVEQCRIVELPHRGAVIALHVVGIYLKHGLGVHVCLLGCAEVPVRLLRLCLLGAMPDEHFPGEGTYRLVVEHVFVELVACAMAHLVVNERIVVDVLLLVGNDTTVA